MEVSEPYPLDDEILPPAEPAGGRETLPRPQDTQLQSEQQPRAKETSLTEALTIKENELAKQAVEKRPEAVLAHVRAAAEQDEPQEAIYELRAEVRDKDDNTKPMVPLSQVVADIPERQPAMARFQTPHQEKSNLTSKGVKYEQVFGNSGSYRRAMAIGFAAGLGLLGVVIMLNIIR